MDHIIINIDNNNSNLYKTNLLYKKHYILPDNIFSAIIDKEYEKLLGLIENDKHMLLKYQYLLRANYGEETLPILSIRYNTPIDIFIKIIEYGFNINLKHSNTKRTIIHYCIIHDRIDILNYLVYEQCKLKVNLSSQDMFGMTPFDLAVYFEKNDMIDFFLKIYKYFDNNEAYNIIGKASKYALLKGDSNTLIKLLENGANINHDNNNLIIDFDHFTNTQIEKNDIKLFNDIKRFRKGFFEYTNHYPKNNVISNKKNIITIMLVLRKFFNNHVIKNIILPNLF